MFRIKPQTLQYWYKTFLSRYNPDIEDKRWHPTKIEIVDDDTGAISTKPVYVFKEENIGSNMSIDDKAIGHDGYTILSNTDSGKIAMMVESTKAKEVEQAIAPFGGKLKQIKNISMDMSPTYALVFSNLCPDARQIIDKFHVMQYVYDAVSEVRIRIKKTLTEKLTKGKKRTAEDRQILSELELLRRVNRSITQSPEKWSEAMQETVNQVFAKHAELKTAYTISQNFKRWYSWQNNYQPLMRIRNKLYEWIGQVEESKIKEFESVTKMILKHDNEILNYFQQGLTNAKAERLNGKINRFVANNYGIKDKDFSMYRIAGYFS